MMKVKAILLIVLVLALGLVACGGGAETAVSPVEAQEIDLATLAPEIDVHTAQALMGRDDVVLIDVREQYEYDEWHIPNITLIPMSEITSRVAEIPTDKEVIITCNSGNRSGQVTDYLRQQGFDNVHNMAGGIQAWNQAGYAIER